MTTGDVTASKGTLRHLDSGRIVFHPIDTSYELHLVSDIDPATIVTGKPVRGVVRVKAKKVYGVPSGGNFIQPILGTPRIIQGRVVSLDERTIFVKTGGAVFVVELPTGLDTIDLHHGAIGANALVNVVALPGAMFERVG